MFGGGGGGGGGSVCIHKQSAESTLMMVEFII